MHRSCILLGLFLAPRLVYGQAVSASAYARGTEGFWTIVAFVSLPILALGLARLLRTLRMSETGRGRLLVLLCAVVLYVVACILPACRVLSTGFSERPVNAASGFEALLFGWFPPYTLPWSANLALFIGLFFLVRRRFRAAAWLGGAATLLALTTIGVIPLGRSSPLLPGYVFWQTAMIALWLGSLMLARKTKLDAASSHARS